MAIRADRRGVYRRAVLDRNVHPDSLVRYYVYQLPAASEWTGAQVFVIDEVGGGSTCFSDGTNWRRLSDWSIVAAYVPSSLSSDGVSTTVGDGVAGPYLVATGAATGTLVGYAFAGVGLSGAGATVGTLGTPVVATGDLSAAAAATGNCVGDIGVGEPSGMNAAGASVATLEGMSDGEPSGLSATSRKCVAVFEGVAA